MLFLREFPGLPTAASNMLGPPSWELLLRLGVCDPEPPPNKASSLYSAVESSLDGWKRDPTPLPLAGEKAWSSASRLPVSPEPLHVVA